MELTKFSRKRVEGFFPYLGLTFSSLQSIISHDKSKSLIHSDPISEIESREWVEHFGKRVSLIKKIEYADVNNQWKPKEHNIDWGGVLNIFFEMIEQ